MRKIRPSNSHTWLRCPGSPALVESLGLPDTTSRFAAEGTAAHQVAERCLKKGAEAKEFEGAEIVIDGADATETFTFVVDQEMIDAVQEYVDIVRRVAGGAEIVVEQGVPMTNVLPGVTGSDGEPLKGTPDAVVIDHDDQIVSTFDLKYGRGIFVDAQRNSQAMIYTLAVMDEYDMVIEPERVEWHIVQPRKGNHGQDDASTVEMEQFRVQVHEKVKLALSCEPGEELYPGEVQCEFCPASGRCPAQAKFVADTVFEDLDALEVKDVEEVTEQGDTQTLGEWRARVPLIEKWCKAVSAVVDQQLEAGVDVPGWKLVEGRRGARAWSDDSEAEQQLKKWRMKKDEMYDMKLISPTKAQKVLTDKRYEQLVEQGLIVQREGKPQAAPISDPRPAIESEQFSDLDNESSGNDDLI
ncbi:DUF2800 domain-containing protein [uncultured Halomonas sp.]|uniref:DUF2800 domain-containing protein n=1 Tax=uncultured Halomonas sp. TaxID=173971 RepID=UPI00261D02F8|nr:DUF2800 domain-containing protein [uncultured Halomonas sp.]